MLCEHLQAVAESGQDDADAADRGRAQEECRQMAQWQAQCSLYRLYAFPKPITLLNVAVCQRVRTVVVQEGNPALNMFDSREGCESRFNFSFLCPFKSNFMSYSE